MLITHYSLLPTHIAHYSPLTTHCLLLTAYYSLPIAYCLLPTAYCLLESALRLFGPAFFLPLLITRRADAVAEVGAGVLMEIGFDAMPVVIIVTDFFAIHADREQPFQLLDLGERRLQFR